MSLQHRYVLVARAGSLELFMAALNQEKL